MRKRRRSPKNKTNSSNHRQALQMVTVVFFRRLNHSCEPNVRLLPAGPKSELLVVAAVDIADGEAVGSSRRLPKFTAGSIIIGLNSKALPTYCLLYGWCAPLLHSVAKEGFLCWRLIKLLVVYDSFETS